MRRLRRVHHLHRPYGALAPGFLATMVTLGSVWACSNNDNATPAPAGGGSGGKAGDGGGGNAGQAGASATSGADNGAGNRALGGAISTEGGVANQGGGNNGGQTSGGAGPAGGVPSMPASGAGGAGGSEGTDQGPPDLITSSGGPWPDSLTGACATPSKAIACPKMADAFFGQDGTYRINVPSYTSTASTIKDSVTGLVWQLLPDSSLKTQAEAATYCDGLQLGGQSDWRLPTRLEYVSLLDEGMGSGYAMPPAVSFDTTGTQWTASATPTAANQFFMINDQFGGWTVGVDTSPHNARCVRGPALGGSLQVETDVVTDTATKLVWQVTALDESSRNWQEALAYCETLSHAGKEDWRLPSIKELATLVDETALVAPAIRAEFGASAPSQYWSSTPAPSFGQEGFAFTLETGVGYSQSQKMTDSAAAARCLRSQD